MSHRPPDPERISMAIECKKQGSHSNDISKFKDSSTINTRKSDRFTINDLVRSFNKKTWFGKCYVVKTFFADFLFQHLCPISGLLRF